MKKTTKEFLISELIRYNKEVGFPTQRKFKASNGLPSYAVYFKTFGSFKNAILESGIEIPENRMRFFNRDIISDKDMLDMFKNALENKLKIVMDVSYINKNSNDLLVVFNDIDKIGSMPHSATYINRFGSIKNIYRKIGLDYDTFYSEKMKEKLIQLYLEMSDILGCVPNSRDIDKFSRTNKKYYCTSTYIRHFNTIHELQYQLGMDMIGETIGMDESEVLGELWEHCFFSRKYPTQKDIDLDKNIPCGYRWFVDRYGSIENALYRAGVNTTKLKHPNCRLSIKGTKCLSIYEEIFCNALDLNDVVYKKEEYYKDYIKGLNRKFRFDFNIYFDNKVYFVEVFTYPSHLRGYGERTKHKIELCGKNNIDLIQYYKEDFERLNYDYELIYKDLMKKIEKAEGRII